jgi:hypothetical protein
LTLRRALVECGTVTHKDDSKKSAPSHTATTAWTRKVIKRQRRRNCTSNTRKSWYPTCGDGPQFSLPLSNTLQQRFGLVAVLLLPLTAQIFSFTRSLRPQGWQSLRHLCLGLAHVRQLRGDNFSLIHRFRARHRLPPGYWSMWQYLSTPAAAGPAQPVFCSLSLLLKPTPKRVTVCRISMV